MDVFGNPGERGVGAPRDAGVTAISTVLGREKGEAEQYVAEPGFSEEPIIMLMRQSKLVIKS
jgi:hypothetical protein